MEENGYFVIIDSFVIVVVWCSGMILEVLLEVYFFGEYINNYGMFYLNG